MCCINVCRLVDTFLKGFLVFYPASIVSCTPVLHRDVSLRTIACADVIIQGSQNLFFLENSDECGMTKAERKRRQLEVYEAY